MPTNFTKIKIVALDPGGTTGYAIHTVSEDGRKLTPTNQLTSTYENAWRGGQLDGPTHHDTLYKFLASENPDVVVYEGFNYQIRRSGNVDMPGVELISREYIGVARLYCQLTKKPDVKQQPSVIGIAWVSDVALKKMGLYTVGKPHQNDATRHLLYYLVQGLGRREYLTALKPSRLQQGRT